MNSFARGMNWDLPLMSQTKVKMIKNGKRRRKKSYSPTRKTCFCGTVWGGGKRRSLSYDSETKPEGKLASAMQFMLLIRTVLASWTADLTEKEHFGQRWTDLQAVAACWTALIQQAALPKACILITAPGTNANTTSKEEETSISLFGGGRTTPKPKVISL